MTGTNVNEEGNDLISIKKDKTTIWKKVSLHKTRINVHTIFEDKRGLINEESYVKSIYECFKVYVRDNIMDIITKSSNIHIDNIRTSYQRERDSNNTDISEIKALIGMLYFIRIITSRRQNSGDIWRKLMILVLMPYTA